MVQRAIQNKCVSTVSIDIQRKDRFTTRFTCICIRCGIKSNSDRHSARCQITAQFRTAGRKLVCSAYFSWTITVIFNNNCTCFRDWSQISFIDDFCRNFCKYRHIIIFYRYSKGSSIGIPIAVCKSVSIIIDTVCSAVFGNISISTSTVNC